MAHYITYRNPYAVKGPLTVAAQAVSALCHTQQCITSLKQTSLYLAADGFLNIPLRHD